MSMSTYNITVLKRKSEYYQAHNITYPHQNMVREGINCSKNSPEIGKGETNGLLKKRSKDTSKQQNLIFLIQVIIKAAE